MRDFVTSSLPFAAYLVATRNLPLREIRLIDPRRAVFAFEDAQGRGSGLEAAFLSGRATVSALAFHHQLRILRRAIDERIFAARSGVNEPHQSQGNEKHVSLSSHS
jgi:hypothetical protein